VASIAVGLLVAGSLLSTSYLAGELQHRGSREYVDAVLRAMDENRDVSVVSTRLPESIVMARYPDVEGLLRAVGEDRRFDEPGTDVRVFDNEGVLRPLVLVGPTFRRSGPLGGCGWALEDSWQRIGDLAGGSTIPDPQVLQVAYVTGQQATLHLAVGGRFQEVRLPAGHGRATFVVTGQQGPVELRMEGAASGAVCVDDVVVGGAWPEGVS
jgi:hypothetical protein